VNDLSFVDDLLKPTRTGLDDSTDATNGSTALGNIKARLISRFMRSTMAAGGPTGAQTPCDVPASKFLNPSSSRAGASEDTPLIKRH
jgi:hypothetical protein